MKTCKSFWLNDPNGPLYFKGRFHMYHQYLPGKTAWGFGLGWGHASSTDLRQWTHHGWALKPSTRYDRDGCFSGNTILHDDRVIAFYTGVVRKRANGKRFHEVQCAAASEDGYTFQKQKTPLLTAPPPCNHRRGWRDPFVFVEDGCHYMLLGSGSDTTGQILLYTGGAHPLHDPYTFTKVLMTHECIHGMLECPFLVKLDACTWILGASPEHEAPVYWEGVFKTQQNDAVTFQVTSGPHVFAEHIPDVYAVTVTPKQYSGPFNRHLWWGWRKTHGDIMLLNDAIDLR